MKLSKVFSRKRIFTLWLATLGVAWIAASQTWFTVEMFPDGQTVELQQFDGLTTYPFITAIFISSAAGLLASIFVQSLARKIVGTITALLAAGAVWLIATKVAAQDLSGISDQLETLTGIAANHGAGDYKVLASAWPWVTLATMLLQLFVVAFFLLVESSWPLRSQKTERTSAAMSSGDEQDSIGIWDAQRK
ncbi:MAG: hypothetical protein RJB56_752 [Actinomycetota bacterium]